MFAQRDFASICILTVFQDNRAQCHHSQEFLTCCWLISTSRRWHRIRGGWIVMCTSCSLVNCYNVCSCAVCPLIKKKRKVMYFVKTNLPLSETECIQNYFCVFKLKLNSDFHYWLYMHRTFLCMFTICKNKASSTDRFLGQIRNWCNIKNLYFFGQSTNVLNLVAA